MSAAQDEKKQPETFPGQKPVCARLGRIEEEERRRRREKQEAAPRAFLREGEGTGEKRGRRRECGNARDGVAREDSLGGEDERLLDDVPEGRARVVGENREQAGQGQAGRPDCEELVEPEGAVPQEPPPRGK